jgi:hypothetical protein
VLLGRCLQVVDLPEFGPDVPVCLLLRHLVVVVVAWLVVALSFDLQHARDIRLLLHSWFWLAFLVGVLEDDPIKFGQVDVLDLRVVCQRDWVFGLGALAQFGHLLVLNSILIVGLGQSVSQIVKILVGANGL